MAEAWCGTGEAAIPADFLRLLRSHPTLHGIELHEGWAEHKTGLRGESRGPRVHDLLLIGRCDIGKVVVGVEGKADEDFDRPLSKRWDIAQATLAAGGATNWPDRIRRLAPALLGVDAEVAPGVLNPVLADVPYQLLSALAGTLIEAEERRAAFAVLAVHVFTSSATRADLVRANRDAFAHFVESVASVPARDVQDGVLYGPFQVPGGISSGLSSTIPVLIGEVTTALATGPRAH